MNNVSQGSVRVFVDASVFVRNSSFGRVSGSIDLSTVPQIGDRILFVPLNKSDNVSLHHYAQFMLEVEGRVLTANRNSSELIVSLSPIEMDDSEKAKLLMTALESDYDLFGEIF